MIKGFSDWLNEKGLWDNIRAKRARGEKPARKGSKAYKRAVKAAKEIRESSQHNELDETEILDLIALGGDTNTKDRDWMEKFDEFYGGAALVWGLGDSQIKKLRSQYVSGDFSWTFRYYKGEYDSSVPEEYRSFMKEGDEKDLDELKNAGWEIYYEDVDGEIPRDTWFYFLLRKPNENPFQSSIVKEYIRNYHDDFSHSSIEALSKFLTAEDARELRGLTGAKKIGLI